MKNWCNMKNIKENKMKVNKPKISSIKKTAVKTPIKPLNKSIPKAAKTSAPIKSNLSLNTLIDEQKRITKPGNDILVKINAFVSSLNSELKRKKINASATLGGSVAKGTFIKDNFDADIFVKFDITYKNKDISGILENVLNNMKLNASRVHGSRDYFQIKKEFTYELVPVLNVSDYRAAENVADMSPLHVNYFLKQNKRIKNLQEEVRVAKLFMKASRVYGAESYIKGFSGHVVDLLIIKYGSFLELVKSAAKWKDDLIIDIEKQHIDPKMSLNSSKISGPLIIVDPLQKNRNAAAAVSKECYERFKEKCRAFIKSPNQSFFTLPNFSEIIDEKIVKTQNADIIILNVVPFDGKRDVIGSKVLKIKEYIEQKAKNEDFILLWSDWEFNEHNSRICIAFDDKKLSTIKILQGPPLDMKDSVEQFKKSHKKTFVKDKTIFAQEKREFLSSHDFLKSAIKNKYISEKCKSISVVPAQKV
jgi:tRNA nucleotidyltransferase (CCA-adding enzyme)